MFGMGKLVGGGLGLKEFAGLLKSMGVELELSEVPRGAAAVAEFRGLGESASLPSSKLMVLRGRMKSGEKLAALLVLTE